MEETVEWGDGLRPGEHEGKGTVRKCAGQVRVEQEGEEQPLTTRVHLKKKKNTKF